MPSISEKWDKLEWSGLCRATPHRNFDNHYWTISDSNNTGVDNWLVLVDEKGIHCASYGVVSPGGGALSNKDWEDIATNDNGTLWILDNIKNGGGVHQLLEFNEPKRFGEQAKLKKIYEFKLKQDVEAVFCYENKPYIISKKANSFGWGATLTYLSPHEIYELEYKNNNKYKVESSLHMIKSIGSCPGFCTAADYIEDYVLIHCYTRSYILDWPKCEILWSCDENFGQTEGACFTKNGKNIVINNESGEYKIKSLKDFILR